jgi:hypothetical protein
LLLTPQAFVGELAECEANEHEQGEPEQSARIRWLLAIDIQEDSTMKKFALLGVSGLFVVAGMLCFDVSADVGMLATGEQTAQRSDEARSISELEKLGARIERDQARLGKPVVTLDLKHTKVTDAGLRRLAHLTQLRQLRLINTKVTDAGLKELAHLTQLQSLDLGSTPVTDAGLKDLAHLTQLRQLDLGLTKVADTGLMELAQLTQLQSLELNNTSVTDAGLKGLAHLTLPPGVG